MTFFPRHVGILSSGVIISVALFEPTEANHRKCMEPNHNSCLSRFLSSSNRAALSRL